MFRIIIIIEVIYTHFAEFTIIEISTHDFDGRNNLALQRGAASCVLYTCTYIAVKRLREAVATA